MSMADDVETHDAVPSVDPILARILEDGLAIQDRFIAEPMLKMTGKGYLKSRGVQGLIEDAEELRQRFAAKNEARTTDT
jgi:hypothetical protein